MRLWYLWNFYKFLREDRRNVAELAAVLICVAAAAFVGTTLVRLGGTAVDGQEVVPCAHAITIVQCDRAHRRMRKHEAQWRHAAVHQLGHQRLEVMAIGAEAVHPDDGEGGLGSGFDDDAFE